MYNIPNCSELSALQNSCNIHILNCKGLLSYLQTKQFMDAILDFHIKTAKSRLTNKNFVFSIPKLDRKSCLSAFPHKCLVQYLSSDPRLV